MLAVSGRSSCDDPAVSSSVFCTSGATAVYSGGAELTRTLDHIVYLLLAVQRYRVGEKTTTNSYECPAFVLPTAPV